MLGRIARTFHLPEEQLRSRLSALRRARRPQPAATQRDAAEQVPPSPHHPAMPSAWDRGLLELILLEPASLARMAGVVDAATFESDVARRIYETCVRLANSGGPIDFQRLSIEFDDAATKNLLVQLDESSQAKASADREQWLQDLLSSVERRRGELLRRQTFSATAHGGEDTEALLARFCQESRTKQLSEYERRKK
jgi:hypothetical protein